MGYPTHPLSVEKAKQAVEKYGQKDQMDMAVGEIGELLKLYGREAQGRLAGEDEWTDEIADVFLMLCSVMHIKSSPEKVSKRLYEKTLRLEEILEEKTQHPHNT